MFPLFYSVWNRFPFKYLKYSVFPDKDNLTFILLYTILVFKNKGSDWGWCYEIKIYGLWIKAIYR